MSRNLVVFSDGTGNHGRVGHETNVWKLYLALDRTSKGSDSGSPVQLAFYDQGVGTEDWKPLRLAGGAVGWGLTRKVCALYVRLAMNYQPGDKIFLFGFSRGAYTVRLLSGLIGIFGVLDLKRVARPEKRVAIMMKALDDARQPSDMEKLREEIHQLICDEAGSCGHAKVDIEVVGVFDTVDAVGVPSDSLRALLDWLWNYRMPDQRPHPSVKAGYHALSIDDERTTFHPVLWNEGSLPKEQIIEQVWFAGVHANVGGGYPTAGLSAVALDWMMTRAERHGLKFLAGARLAVRAEADVGGRMYDSRSGLKSYYRYGPRLLADQCRAERTKPRIHESVFQRIEESGGEYAPLWIPGDATVVSTEETAPLRDLAGDQAWLLRTEGQDALLKGRSLSGWPRRVNYEVLLFGTLIAFTSRLWGPWVGLPLYLEPLPVLRWLPEAVLFPLKPLLCDWLTFLVALVLLLLALLFKLVLFKLQRRAASYAWSITRG
ncbi:MAG TPA: DUF2235 domain-containing protein [Planctomycetota bacterium]|jgi:uncharacterized protein (DUF2235 family)|nr:DUF2235 domain-containing protein [Planctomycetota bacterium]